MKTLRIATLSSAVLDTFSTLALAAVAIMLGFRLVDGSLEFLPALMVLIMVPGISALFASSRPIITPRSTGKPRLRRSPG